MPTESVLYLTPTLIFVTGPVLWESLGLCDDPDFPITLCVACANHVCVWHELFWDWTTIALPQIGIQASRPSRNPLLSNLVDLTPALFPPFKSSDSECSGNLADLSCGYLLPWTIVMFSSLSFNNPNCVQAKKVKKRSALDVTVELTAAQEKVGAAEVSDAHLTPT